MTRHAIPAVVRAGADAGRAWAMAPIHYAKSDFARNAVGGWGLRSQRSLETRERLQTKSQLAREVFDESVRLGIAQEVIVSSLGDEGLMTNLLHVIEVLHRVRPDARVHVDWVLKGSERGFRYGMVGDDVWTGLFRTLAIDKPGRAYRASLPIDFAFWGTGRDYLTGKQLKDHRRAYHRTTSKWIEITNQIVLTRTRRIRDEFFDGRFCLGVHRRVGNALVDNLQADGKVPSLRRLIERCESLLQTASKSNGMVFLATDDAEAVDAFGSTFGPRLIVQDQVKRTTANEQEVHYRSWRQLSLSDAEDVLVDTLLLSSCDALVHASSSISTVASILNPNLPLFRVFENDE